MNENKKASENSGFAITTEEKRTAALTAALSLAFNLCAFSPIDFYLNNFSEISVPYGLVLISCLPAGILLFAAVYLLLRFTRGKAFVIAASAVVGINTAAYIQGNFLTIGMAKLDGTAYTVSALRAAADLLFWAAMIALPLVLFRFSKNVFKKFIVIAPLAVIVELAVVLINAGLYSDLNIDFEAFVAYCDTENEFTLSTAENHIVFIADQYDSFVFDNAVSIEPDSVSGFDGFTYYNNTIGMYYYTNQAMAYLFGQKMTKMDSDYQNAYNDDVFFAHIPEDYRVEIYADDGITMPKPVLVKWGDNYKSSMISYKNLLNISLAMYDMVLYRNAPDIAKGFFWMYSVDFSNKVRSVDSYFSENYKFYQSLPDSIEYTDQPCYKLYYLKGIHSSRRTNENMEYEPEGAISPTRTAIGVNKIISAYLELLKEGGVYDNSDIIILADHGHRPNYDAKYPLLMIKRKNDTFDGIRTSSVPVSYADLFPTGCYLLGDESMKDKSIFVLKEGQKRERYFAGTDEYITDDVDRSLPLHE